VQYNEGIRIIICFTNNTFLVPNSYIRIEQTVRNGNSTW